MSFIEPSYVDKYFECLSGNGHISGQNAENYNRNIRFLESSSKDFKKQFSECSDKFIDIADVPNLPFNINATKTGTTIVGVKCVDAVVLAADTRATSGPIVSTKNCQKLHRIADNVYAAGAGIAGDLDHTGLWLQNNAELYRLNNKRKVRVSYCVSLLVHELFRYMGYKQCAVIMGGYDPTGFYLYSIHPHGSCEQLPYATLGSGSLNAMSVLESKYRDNLNVSDATNLAVEAITSGIMNDLGSGSNVDVVIISKDGTKLIRPYATPGYRPFPPPVHHFPIGSTKVISESVEFVGNDTDNYTHDEEMS